MYVVSDFDSIVGLHYYYALPQGTGTVTSDVQKTYCDGKELKPIPADWPYDSQHQLRWDLDQPADYTFYPFFDPLNAKILLDAGTYKLQVSYSSICQENSWQLYHPKGASFVCIEPLSAQLPRRPNLTVSSINVLLKILE
jgi:galactose mutarotase-like enzyme